MLRRSRQRRVAALAACALALAACAPAAAGASGRAPTASASAAHTRIVHLTSVRDKGIYTMTPQGGDRHRIRKGWVDALSVTPSGRRMAFARERSTPCSRCTADFFVDILVADGRGHHSHRVKRFKHAGLESVAISPDGRWIVASIVRGEGFDLYAVRADGRGTRRLTHGGGDELGVSFAPDGKRIVFAREGGGGSAMYTMRLRGGGLHRVSRGSGDFTDPVFSPNGRLIAFSRGDGGSASACAACS